jgi:phospholipid/cholesterol/gamma-HCH transport system substrate-binding protein
LKLRSVLSLGAIAAVSLLGVGYMTFGVLGYQPFERQTTVVMLVTNSGGLNVGSPVLLSGARVGEVASVGKSVNGVRIAVSFSARYEIPASSTIKIENLSALGEPYVNFAPSRDTSSPYLSDHQIIDARSVDPPRTIPEMSTRLVELLDQFDPEALGSLIDTIDRATAGTGSEIPRLERSTKLLAATLISREPQIRSLLNDLQSLGGDMSWLGPSLTTAGPELAKVGAGLIDAVNAQSKLAEIGSPATDYTTDGGLVPFLQELTTLLAEIGPAIAELTPVLQPLAAEIVDSSAALDVSALISQAVSAVGDGSAIHLQIDLN